MGGNSLKQQLDEDGYVVVDGLIPPEMEQPLKEACERIIAKARNDEWKHRRIAGVQFPPWPEDGPDVWGIQHVMHPDLGEPIFAQWYGSPALLGAVCDILGVKEEELQLELFNLLINPRESDYQLTWHRDAIPIDATEEEEREKLKIPHYGTQWNTALYDDDALIVVPGSHLRVRTPEERDTMISDGYAPLPGEKVVKLKAGQTVFYNNNILHRARYSCKQRRVTLHACMGCTVGGAHRAQNILQHGLSWMREERFRQMLPASLLGKYANLIRLADAQGDSEVGFSHPR
ncbi:uncharacterized protein VTP21DRAFT_7510 [Calcarisporiella thermophila]|uniref:uncharacterized protein n=1 Tax=Calcarisporiella thermophila TaxID=911321 RepID=UPI0037442E7E